MDDHYTNIDLSECAMRREYRRPIFLWVGVLLQLLALWMMQVMGGGCDASASFLKGRVFGLNSLQKLRVGRNLRDELQQNIIKNVMWRVQKSAVLVVLRQTCRELF